MKIKLYKCECFHCVFPFGNGIPICIRELDTRKEYPFGMKPCIEKGCEHYIKYEPLSAKKESANK